MNKKIILVLLAAVCFSSISCVDNSKQLNRHVYTKVITPGIYLEKYCTHESGAGIYDTGTDYEYYVTDSAGHRLDIGPEFEHQFFHLRLRDSLLLVRKVCRMGDMYGQAQNLSGYKVEDSMVYNLKSLGFIVPESTPASLSQKKKALDSVADQMIRVKGAGYIMGSAWTMDQMPDHLVKLSDFYISKYEVTQDLWESVMGYNPSAFRNCSTCPVENVDWLEVQIFLRELNKITNDVYRLPTEAEWEFAARGGINTKGYRYCGSNVIDSVAWRDENSSNKTHPVGQKQPNELGIYDMSGNVSEWCSDWYSQNYEVACQTLQDPTGVDKGDHKIIRGGGWNNSIYDMRPADRQRSHPQWGAFFNCGFRLAKSIVSTNSKTL
jgi:formylglycine-generating enzyme required for sulfatase activity